MTLARPPKGFGKFDETLVERQIMADRVLPALVGSSEERELLLEELVDLGQSELLAGDGLDGHHYEGDVAVWRLLLPPHSCNENVLITEKML